jgi:protein TonB
MWRLALWLLASIAVHAVLLSAVLALVGLSPRPLPVLFVDLVQGFLGAGERRGTAGDGARAGAAGSGSPRGGETTSARPPIARPGGPAAPSTRADRRPHRPPRAPDRLPEPPAVALDPAPQPQPMPPGLSPPPVVSPPPPVQPDAPRLAAPPPPGADSPAAPGARQSQAPPGASGPGPRDDGGRQGAPAGNGVSAGIREGGRGESGDGRTGGRAAAGEGPGSGNTGEGLALAIPGDGRGPEREYDGYMSLLRRRIQEALAYPAAARRRSLTGTVQIEMSILPTGEITQVALVESSSHRALDEAAVDAARQVGNVPFPPGIAPRALRVRLPVVFDLRARP